MECFIVADNTFYLVCSLFGQFVFFRNSQYAEVTRQIPVSLNGSDIDYVVKKMKATLQYTTAVIFVTYDVTTSSYGMRAVSI